MRKYDFSLQPFKRSKTDLQITGNLCRENHTLSVNYALKGDLNQIEIPTIAEKPSRKHELWETTCFEFFLGLEGSNRYWEFNLSPSGDWNIYRFENYREGMEEDTAVKSIPFNILRDSNSLFLSLEFNMHQLLPIVFNFKVSTTAVIKDKYGDISYWAVKHCAEEADFHLRDSILFYV
ncbi:MAG: DOMON-like domain-containing protein [Rivularia sp. (in: cyanobacteria)]